MPSCWHGSATLVVVDSLAVVNNDSVLTTRYPRSTFRYLLKSFSITTKVCGSPTLFLSLGTILEHLWTLAAGVQHSSMFSHVNWFLPREAMLSAVFAVVVCLCVCVSVTLRYCIKTAKRRITQTTPHDSPMTLVFWCQRSWRNSNRITPYGGYKCRWGGLKLVSFDEKRAITRKRYKIDV